MNIRILASLCGVSKTTVSLALRGGPKVSMAVAQRIRAAAASAGYAPDPRLAAALALVARRNRGGPSATFAFICGKPESRIERRRQEAIFAGAARAATEYHFKLDKLEVATHAWREERLRTVLRTRATAGAIIIGAHLSFEWKRALGPVTAIFIGTEGAPDAAHLVEQDHLWHLDTALNYLRRHGLNRKRPTVGLLDGAEW